MTRPDAFKCTKGVGVKYQTYQRWYERGEAAVSSSHIVTEAYLHRVVFGVWFLGSHTFAHVALSATVQRHSDLITLTLIAGQRLDTLHLQVQDLAMLVYLQIDHVSQPKAAG